MFKSAKWFPEARLLVPSPAARERAEGEGRAPSEFNGASHRGRPHPNPCMFWFVLFF